MFNISAKRGQGLSELEQLVMDFVWSRSHCTAEEVRDELAATRPLKDSTIRTVLRRLESKGYVSHVVEGRRYLYRFTRPRHNVAVRAIRHIIDRFCEGSVEQLLTGMVDDKLINRKELAKLARRLASEKRDR